MGNEYNMETITCFSGECGYCTSCSGSIGMKAVDYISPVELYKRNTGEEPPSQIIVKDPRQLYIKMLKTSEEFRNSKSIQMWEKFTKFLNNRYKLFNKSYIYDDIKNSHIEFLNGCKEEGKIYGEKRCMKLSPEEINDFIYMGKVDPKNLYGKVWCSGGGYYDLDARRRQANLKDEDYEIYFDKFSDYLVKVKEEMKGYGGVLGGYNSNGNLPLKFTIHGEEYTFTNNQSAMCDNVECSLMCHCMINWDCPENYRGEKKPRHNSFYYSAIISKIPKYTKNMKHELCLLCVKDAVK